MRLRLIFIFTLLFAFQNSIAQTKKFDQSGTVTDQFDYVYKKSSKYQEYKVVRADWLLKLKKNVIDSISETKTKLNTSNTKIAIQKKSIDSLNTALSTSKNSIQELDSKIQTISFLGMEIDKNTFKTILFSIIGLLLILLVAFIYKFKNSNAITVQAKNDLKELDEEFEAHRKKALEREQKVRRQLQDEINKQKKE